MLFLKNLRDFLEQCRLHQRKIFTRYQWDYIQSALQSHQYLSEVLGKFSSPFFEKIYDASVLHYDELNNHIHDVRYNSRKNIIFSKIQTIIKDHLGTEELWQFDKQLLKSGYYRNLLLHWDEVASDTTLRDYVNFLFDRLENEKITATQWVVCCVVWGGVALEKEPFIAALRDSQQAYEHKISNAVYKNQSYSCMNGLEDRIGQFYSYLDTSDELPLKEQPLPLQYVNTATMPFITPCSDYGFKPTTLLYSLYLQARFDSYHIEYERSMRSLIVIPQERYDILKNAYVSKQLELLFRELHTLYGASEVFYLRFSQMMSQAVLRPWQHLLAQMLSPEGLVAIESHGVARALANYFDEEVEPYRQRGEINDFLKERIEHFGLQSCVVLEAQTQKILRLSPEAMNQTFSFEDFCRQCEAKNLLPTEVAVFLNYLPGTTIFEQLQLWCDEGYGEVLGPKQIEQEMRRQRHAIMRLEKNLFDTSLTHMIQRKPPHYADYLWGSHALISYINSKLRLLAKTHDVTTMIRNGGFIFAQDSLTSKYLMQWLFESGLRLQTIYTADDEEGSTTPIFIGENISFLEELIKHGYDATVLGLMNQACEIYSDDLAFFIADEQSEACDFFGALCQRPMLQSTLAYLEHTKKLSLIGQHDVILQKALDFGNLDVLENLMNQIEKERLLESIKEHQAPNIIIDVINTRDLGAWRWFQRNFSGSYDIFEEALSVEHHPINHTLLLPDLKMRELERVVKIFPNFLQKFIKKSDSFHDPLKKSLLVCPEMVSFLISLSCYQKYLFRDHIVKVLDYIAIALDVDAIQSADALLSALKQSLPTCSRSKKLINKLRNILLGFITHLISDNKIERMLRVEFQKLYTTALEIGLNDLTYSLLVALLEKDVELSLIEIIIKQLQLSPTSVSLVKAADSFAMKALNDHNPINKKGLIFLINYGCWPEETSQKRLLSFLMSTASEQEILGLLDCCYRLKPHLLKTFFDLLGQEKSQKLITGTKLFEIWEHGLQHYFDQDFFDKEIVACCTLEEQEVFNRLKKDHQKILRANITVLFSQGSCLEQLTPSKRKRNNSK